GRRRHLHRFPAAAPRRECRSDQGACADVGRQAGRGRGSAGLVASREESDGGDPAMSKHLPDTVEANAGLTTGREASRRDHLPYIVRHVDDVDWETIRWPGETGKMLFHPRPERPT